MSEIGGGRGRLNRSLAPGYDVVTHLVGKVDEVELFEIKTLLSDRAWSLVIIVIFGVGDSDVITLKDELIGSADVFVKAVRREFDKIEQFPSVELTPGRHRETLLAEHGFEAFDGSKNSLLAGLVGLKAASTFGFDFVKTADGHLGLVLITKTMEEINHVGMNSIIGVNKCNPFASGKFKPGVARHGKTLIRLMNDFDALVLFGKNIAKGAAHVGGAVVNEDNLEIRIDLLTNGIDTALENFRDIVHRYDDGDEREIRLSAHARFLHLESTFDFFKFSKSGSDGLVHIVIGILAKTAAKNNIGFFGGEGLVLLELSAVFSGIDWIIRFISARPSFAVFTDNDGFTRIRGVGSIGIGGVVGAFGVKMFEFVDTSILRLKVGVVHDGATLEVIDIQDFFLEIKAAPFEFTKLIIVEAVDRTSVNRENALIFESLKLGVFKVISLKTDFELITTACDNILEPSFVTISG